MAKKHQPRKSRQLVLGYLERVSSRLFSEFPKQLTALVGRKHGIYALYKGEHLYYVGLATNLRSRIKHHLKDKHANKWDRFSIYLIRKADHIRELEALILRTAGPHANQVRGRLKRAEDLRGELLSNVQQETARNIQDWLGLKKSRRPIRVSRKGSPKKKPNRIVGATKSARRLSIFRVYKGTTYRARFLPSGEVIYNEVRYSSPTAAAKAVTGREAINGWSFWSTKSSSGKMVKLGTLRKQ